MKDSNTLLSSKPSLKKFFLDNSIRCANKICISSDGVLEVKNDGISFGVEIDYEGNQCTLVRRSVTLERNQPKTSYRSLKTKTMGIFKELNDQRRIR